MESTEIQVGTRVRVANEIGRQDSVEKITVNSQGTTLYWLSRGGIFSRCEIEIVKKLSRIIIESPSYRPTIRV